MRKLFFVLIILISSSLQVAGDLSINQTQGNENEEYLLSDNELQNESSEMFTNTNSSQYSELELKEKKDAVPERINKRTSNPKHQLSLTQIYQTTAAELRSEKTITVIIENYEQKLDQYNKFGEVTSYENLPLIKLEVTVDKLIDLEELSNDDILSYTPVTNNSAFSLNEMNLQIDTLSGTTNNYFDNLGINYLHSLGLSGEGVTIGILGDGIQPHADLLQRSDGNPIILDQKSFIDLNSDNEPDPIFRTKNDYTFSTIIAGLISSNGVSSGISPNTKLIDVVIGSSSYFSLSWYLDAINWMIMQQPDIVILPPIIELEIFEVMLDELWDAGILPITLSDFSPHDGIISFQNLAKSNKAIITRGMDKMEWEGEITASDYSLHYNKLADIYAPLDFVSTTNAIGYDYVFSHISSVGVVAGTVALLKEAFPDVSIGKLKAAITNGTTHIIHDISFSLLNGTSSYKTLYEQNVIINSKSFNIASEPFSEFSNQIEFALNSSYPISINPQNFPENVELEFVNHNKDLFTINLKGLISSTWIATIDIMENGLIVETLSVEFLILDQQSDLGTDQDAGEVLDSALSIKNTRKLFGYISNTDPIDVYSFKVNNDGLYILRSEKGFIRNTIQFLAFDGYTYSFLDIFYNYYWNEEIYLTLDSALTYYLVISLNQYENHELYSFELLHLSSFDYDNLTIEVEDIYEENHLSLDVYFEDIPIQMIDRIEIVIAQYRSDYEHGKYQFERRWGDRNCYWTGSREECSDFFHVDINGDLLANSNYTGRYIISDLIIFTTLGEIYFEDIYITNQYSYSDFEIDEYELRSININAIDNDNNLVPEYLEILVDIANLNYDWLDGMLILTDEIGTEITSHPFRRDGSRNNEFPFAIYPTDILMYDQVWLGKIVIYNIGTIPVYIDISSYLSLQFEEANKFEISHFFEETEDEVIVGLTLEIDLSEEFQKYYSYGHDQGFFQIMGYYLKNNQGWIQDRYTEEFGLYSDSKINYYIHFPNLNVQVKGEELIILGNFMARFEESTAQFFYYTVQLESSKDYSDPVIELKSVKNVPSISQNPIFELQLLNTREYMVNINLEIIYRYSGETRTRSSWITVAFFGIFFVSLELNSAPVGKMKQVDILSIIVREVNGEFEQFYRINKNFDLITVNDKLHELFELKKGTPKIIQNEFNKIISYSIVYEFHLYNSTGMRDLWIHVNMQGASMRNTIFVNSFNMNAEDGVGVRYIEIDLYQLNIQQRNHHYSPDDLAFFTFYIDFYRDINWFTTEDIELSYEIQFYFEEVDLIVTPNFDQFSYSQTLTDLTIGEFRKYNVNNPNSEYFGGIEFEVDLDINEITPQRIELQFILLNSSVSRYHEFKAFVNDITIGENTILARIKKFAFERILWDIRNVDTFSLKLNKVIVTADTFSFPYLFEITSTKEFSMYQYDDTPIIQDLSSSITVNDDLDLLFVNLKFMFSDFGNYRLSLWIDIRDDYEVYLFNDYKEIQYNLNNLREPSDDISFHLYVGDIIRELGYGNLYISLGLDLYEQDYEWGWGNWWEEEINLDSLGYSTIIPGNQENQNNPKGQKQPLFKIYSDTLIIIITLVLLPKIISRYRKEII